MAVAGFVQQPNPFAAPDARFVCCVSSCQVLTEPVNHGWSWEKVEASLSQLASHVGYYWAVHQRDLRDKSEALEQAKQRLAEAEARLRSAAPVASDLKRLSARLGRGGARLGAPGQIP
eukprot:4814359-Prymnesium_polylepis.1